MIGVLLKTTTLSKKILPTVSLYSQRLLSTSGKRGGSKKKRSNNKKDSKKKEHDQADDFGRVRIVEGWEYSTMGDRYTYYGKDEDTGEPEFIDWGPPRRR